MTFPGIGFVLISGVKSKKLYRIIEKRGSAVEKNVPAISRKGLSGGGYLFSPFLILELAREVQ